MMLQGMLWRTRFTATFVGLVVVELAADKLEKCRIGKDVGS
jgi:hypothetical protein